MKRTELLNKIAEIKTRSAWGKGVKEYAQMITENADYLEDVRSAAELLNGAENWKEYSYGGCALIYNGDIAETVCAPLELKKTDGGRKEPNKSETWLDVQTRALYQAARMVDQIIKAQ